VIYNPIGDGRIPQVSVAAPGFVGSVTAMNADGFVLGVDVVRAVAANATTPGLNSILLVRHTALNAKTVNDAATLMENTFRGVPFLYPMCDGTGDCAVIEATKSDAGPFDPLSYADEELLPLLPDADFIASHVSAPFRHGLFVRKDDYVYPSDYLNFNPGLFAYAGVPYNASDFGVTGSVFVDWNDEANKTESLGSDWFPAQREIYDNVVLVSNTALVPDARISMMATIPFVMMQGTSALHWRYDSMVNAIHNAYGSIDNDLVKHMITFLAPNRSPGYWQNPLLDPTDPMSQQIPGAICTADVTHRQFWAKTGYWSDDWIGISLTAYIQ